MLVPAVRIHLNISYLLGHIFSFKKNAQSSIPSTTIGYVSGGLVYSDRVFIFPKRKLPATVPVFSPVQPHIPSTHGAVQGGKVCTSTGAWWSGSMRLPSAAVRISAARLPLTRHSAFASARWPGAAYSPPRARRRPPACPSRSDCPRVHFVRFFCFVFPNHAPC